MSTLDLLRRFFLFPIGPLVATAYGHTLNSLKLAWRQCVVQLQAMPGAQYVSNRFIDEHNIIFYGALTILAVSNIVFVYNQNSFYWTLIFGECGPAAESILMILLAAITFWIRQVSFPATRGTSEYPTRHSKAFRLSFASSLALLTIYFTYVNHVSYLYPTPPYYYVMWCLPLALYVSWSVEVIWAVCSAYKPKNLLTHMPNDGNGRLKAVSDYELEKLADRVASDTKEMIWPLGTIAFFFLGYFKDFYLVGSTWITYMVIAALVWISIWPLLWVQVLVSPFFDKEIQRVSRKISHCQQSRIHIIHFSPEWKKFLSEEKEYRDEVDRIKSIRDRFNIASWFKARSKDIIPLSAIQIVGPTLLIPEIDQLVQSLGLDKLIKLLN